ncbi:phage portal protein [Cohnella xylanilytica]|uniref:Phage portal protein n=1 Tax=Cohnella xylanilytica TaxID=557555 RepID=A0A841TQC1_9BACL|nr:phage portal protein [Cohnella xylanilytica]MBB6689919.1 phage portal protein [Cohnella xylanilytica]
MTIVYSKQRFPPPPFDKDVTSMAYFRALYDGDHAEIFPRAKMIAKDVRYGWKRTGVKSWAQTQEIVDVNSMYVVANFSSLVAEVPADLINRALGNISADTENDKALLDFVSAVVTASKPNEKIWAAVTQHQVDGSIAYRVRRDGKGKVWFEWIMGDNYFPHDDGQGADLAWIEKWNESTNPQKFLRVERQRLDAAGLTVQQMVFKMEGDTVGDEIETASYAAQWGVEIPEDVILANVTELLCGFIANDETLRHKRGRSALRNIDTIQEEINWTITRDSIVFDKHGKPKLAIPRGLWDSVAQENNRHYGQRFVRNADLEVVSYDESKGAIPQYITWDAKTQQSFEHVTRLIKYMLAISKTSPQAAGLEEGKGDTGVALLYLWIQSVIKAEAIKEKFDAGIKDAIRKCIVLENAIGGSDYKVQAPAIEWGDMLPKADSEKDTEEIEKYGGGVQSLETTVRRMHPDWSEEAIAAEIQKIQDEKAMDSINPTYTQPPKVTV